MTNYASSGVDIDAGNRAVELTEDPAVEFAAPFYKAKPPAL